MKIRNLALASFLLAAFLVPLPASAAVCENGICTENFQYTGSSQTWQVPGGVSRISFKIYGASGGRGGAGGEVRGELTSLPSVLNIYVGGQGTEGANAPGGYNGGGATTGNRGNEGSGGGASDIRFGTALSDRVVVAGGGGGSGGYAGAPGGMGGGLVAEAGGSGQGGGGSGGNQTAGGSAGYSNGGSPATSGFFGGGGSGGFSWNAGGGGGGGGWYGGGGGGPDDNSCCSDGGGGGGGSSYARSDITLNVQHQPGVNIGHGRIEISYQFPITLVSFTGEQIDHTLARFALVMSANISGLTSEDFLVSPTTCLLEGIAVTGASAEISLTNCPHGLVELTLKSASIGAAPVSAVSAAIDFDRQAPTLVWGEVAPAIASAELAVGFSLTEVTLTAQLLETGECSASVTEQQLLLSNCPEGENVITLPANQLVDQWGNAGPAQPQSFYFLVDLTAPDGTWTAVEITQSENYRYQTVLQLSESFEFDPSSVTFTADAECVTGFEQTDIGWQFFADCPYASGNWTLPAQSLEDALGNIGPLQERIALFSNPAPLAPVPAQTQPPVAVEQPSPQPEPSGSSSGDSTPNQPAADAAPVEVVTPSPVLEDPVVVPEVEVPPVFVIENPPLLDPLPQVVQPSAPNRPISEQNNENLAVEPEFSVEEEIIFPQPATEPILLEEQPASAEPPYLLFALVGLVLLAGLVGVRVIGR
jgi:hypothetical protein